MKFSLVKNSQGSTLIEVTIASSILLVVLLMGMQYSSLMNKNTQLNRTVNVRDRVHMGIRSLAGMPAALRSSLRAAQGGVPTNPQLLACVGGNPLNSCTGGTIYPFTLFSPLIARTASGAILGVQPISSPLGSTTPMCLNLFGSPCATVGPDCPLLVFTSFRAQCGPPPLAVPPTGPPNLVPQNVCTVADVVEVFYLIQLDSSISATDPGMASLVSPIQGSIVTPVVAISGNVPQ